MLESASASSETLMPALFIAHGAPTIVLQKDKYVDFLTKFPQTIKKPEAIVIFSAHYESPIQLIGSVKQYEMIYDFFGFPQPMYEMKYEAKGHPALAQEIHQLFTENNIKSELDDERGIDHGAWTILKLMYPECDIPVVTLSVDPDRNPQELYNIGKALAPLRKKGVLIIGSGNTVHNLRILNRAEVDAPTEKWADEFDDWVEKQLKEWNVEELVQFEKKAPHAKKAVPTNEHFIPLIMAAGAADGTRKGEPVWRSSQFGNLTYFPWRFD